MDVVVGQGGEVVREYAEDYGSAAEFDGAEEEGERFEGEGGGAAGAEEAGCHCRCVVVCVLVECWSWW